MDLSVILLALFSTLLAVSTFITGQLFQLRTVNLYASDNYSLAFFALHEEESQRRSARQYADKIKGHKKTIELTGRAFWVSLGGTAIILLGWLASAICLLFPVWTWYASYAIILALLGIGLSGLSVCCVVVYHKKYLLTNPGPDDMITDALRQYD